VNNYARLLDVEVEGEPSDYLLWEAVDVVGTFADAAKDPDVEHLCIAVLALEGATTEIASANWDGLVEKSVSLLAGEHAALSVSARPADLQEPQLRARLIKFHGCAIKASHDEATYRPFLVARKSQIDGWCQRLVNAPFVTRLVDLIATRPTLMLGLSAQDSNIQALFTQAAEQLAWRWPGPRPSYVFSENELGGDQRGLLRNVYRLDITDANRNQIYESARIRAYAKPLLLALVLHVLCTKLRRLIELAPGLASVNERAALQEGVTAIRNAVADSAGVDPLAFITSFLKREKEAMQLVRHGRLSPGPRAYEPVSSDSLINMPGSPELAASGLREVAVGLGILGAGLTHGHWTLTLPGGGGPADGMVKISSSGATAKVYVTSSALTALELRQEGYVVDAEAPIVIQAQKLIPAMQRSPRGPFGRTRKASVREVSIASLLQTCTTFDEIMQRFREELAV
jgi:hypothetical protein